MTDALGDALDAGWSRPCGDDETLGPSFLEAVSAVREAWGNVHLRLETGELDGALELFAWLAHHQDQISDSAQLLDSPGHAALAELLDDLRTAVTKRETR